MCALWQSSHVRHLIGRGLCSLSVTSSHTHSIATLKDEVLHFLNLDKEQCILDMTFGCGLHTESILKASEKTKVVAVDRDPFAFNKAKELASLYPGRVIPLLGCFSDLPVLLHSQNIHFESLDGILLDVGCSAMQIAESNRGFNPNANGFLDMRMDHNRIPKSITAADVLAKCCEHDLHKILKVYGEEKISKKLAKAIVTCRYQHRSLQSTTDLKILIHECLEGNEKGVQKNVFYALRAFVNNEINELNYGMILAQKFMKKGGHLVTLTYNQLEDLIVKRHIAGLVFENSPAPMDLKYYTQTLTLDPDEIERWKVSPWHSLTKHVISTPREFGSQVLQSSLGKLRAAVKH